MKKFSFFFLFFLFLIISGTVFGQVILTVAGNDTTFGYSGDGGPAIKAVLNGPFGLTFDHGGNLYVCDKEESCIRKISPAYGGIITTVAGNGHTGYSGDGGPAIYAELDGVFNMAIDNRGSLYIADANNNCIRKISVTDTITTIAGTGVAGYNGDSIAAISAQLYRPYGVAVDSVGNIYIAERSNYRIRKIDTSGMITTIAGTGIKGFSGDSLLAIHSMLEGPLSIKLNKAGELFVCDSDTQIRKIDTNGYMITVAGNGIEGSSGDGSTATSAELSVVNIDLDSAGNIYTANEIGTIRKVSTTGVITTIAGGSTDRGDGENPLLAQFPYCVGVTVSREGDVYISESHRVRIVTNHLDVNEVGSSQNKTEIYPNPNRNEFTIQINTAIKETAELSISTIDGKELYHKQVQTKEQVPVITRLPAGFYIVNMTTAQQHFVNKLIIQ